MIRRTLALLILIGVTGGGLWYLLRNTPQKELQRRRMNIQKLVFSAEDNEWLSTLSEEERATLDLSSLDERLKRAREESDAILSLYPTSRYDLRLRGLIEEMAGDRLEALRWYDKLASLPRPPPVVELRRARILRSLGFYSKAKGAIASVVDEYPFESNYEMGRLQVAGYNAMDAYQSFQRALEHAGTDEEKREALEGVASSLEVLIALNRRQSDTSPEAEERAQLVEVWRTERDQTLERATGILKKFQPKSRQEFVASRVKMVELLRKHSEPDLEAARGILLESLANDVDGRYVTLRVLLGALDLELSRGAATADSRSQFMREAEENFGKAFRYEIQSGDPDRIAEATGWRIPTSVDVTPEQFRAVVLLNVARVLVGHSESWRIVPGTSERGPDPLQVRSRIRDALASPEVSDRVKAELRVIELIAQLHAKDEPAYAEGVEAYLESGPEEERPARGLQLARSLASHVPEALVPLLQLLDEEVLRPGETLREGVELGKLKAAVDVLHTARGFRVAKIAEGGTDHAESEVRREIALLTERIRGILLEVARRAESSGPVILASEWAGALVGPGDPIDILREARGRFRNDNVLRYAIGVASLRAALQEERESGASGAWDLYHSAFREFFHLFVSYPYNGELLSRLTAITAASARGGDARSLAWEEILDEPFPELGEQNKRALAKALKAFFARDYEAVGKNLPEPDTALEARPFLNLIAGVSFLEVAEEFYRRLLQTNPETSGEITVDEVNARLWGLQQRAREEFERGLAIDAAYLPIQLELVQMDLDSVLAGEGVPDTLIGRIRGLVETHPGIPQVPFLLSRALRMQRENVVSSGDPDGRFEGLLAAERAALRKAIRANPGFADAYIALAETYVADTDGVGPWTRRKPDHSTAVTILKSAPLTPATLARLASYHSALADLRAALGYSKSLLAAEPVDANVHKVVQVYLELREFEGARNWLQGLDGSSIEAGDFEISRAILLAGIAAAEADSSRTLESRRAALLGEQITLYEGILERSARLGREPPVLAVNNLAILLTERGHSGDRDRALRLIEDLVETLESRRTFFRGSVEDVRESYAWILFKNDQLEKANHIYEDLCARSKRPVFLLNYAEVLVALQQYEKARDQVEVVLGWSTPEANETAQKRAKNLHGKIMVELQRRFDSKTDFSN